MKGTRILELKDRSFLLALWIWKRLVRVQTEVIRLAIHKQGVEE